MTVLGWVPVKDAERYAVAIYNLSGGSGQRLQLSVGDSVQVQQRCGDWYLGFSLKNPAFRGIFPRAFVRIKKCIVDRSLGGAGVIPRENPLVHEITSVLREWGQIWKNLFVIRDQSLPEVAEMMHELIRHRRKIISGTLPSDELRDVKRRVTATIDRGNLRLGLDLVVRDEQGSMLNPEVTSAIRLYRSHQQASRRLQAPEEGSADTPPAAVPHNSHCLYVTLQNCVCRLDEDAEIILFLYDGVSHQVLTENYVVNWKEGGLEPNMDQLSSMRILFTDLSSSDLALERMLLVAYIVKVGTSTKHDHSNRRSMPPSSKSTRRVVELCRTPAGVAALELAPALLTDRAERQDDPHHFMPFVSCGDKDSLEDTLRRLLRDMSGRDYKGQGQGLPVTFRLLHGDKEQHPHLAKTAVARRRGFPEVILPTDVRNDLYLTLVGGEFNRVNKVQDRSIEVTVRVCNRDGSVRQGVIHPGAGCGGQDEFRSVVYWHESQPRWGETFKVVLPIEGDCDSHLRFSFKHRSFKEVKDKSEKPFGLAFVKLLQCNGTTLPNTTHELNVYKVDAKKYDDADMSYLMLPGLRSEVMEGRRPSQGAYQLSMKESFTLRSLTCSTKLTQDVNLLGLLKWSSEPEALKERLEMLHRVDKEEIVKFLRDSLDALFHILIRHEEDDAYDTEVFNALVTIISSVTERRYQHFQPVLEAYLDTAFSATIVDKKLMGVMQRYLDTIETPESQLRMLPALGCLRYVFKFIIKSRQLFIKMNGSQPNSEFECSVQRLLRSFADFAVMPVTSSEQSGVEAVQREVLQHLPDTVDHLVSVCDPVHLSEVMAELVSRLAAAPLDRRRLSVVSRLVHSQLMARADCRHVLLAEIARALALTFELQHKQGVRGMATLRQKGKSNAKLAKLFGEQRTEMLGLEQARVDLQRSQEELRLCIDILSDSLDVLWSQRGTTSSDVTCITLHLLRKVIQTVIQVDRQGPLVCSLVAVLVSMLRQMEKQHYDTYIAQFSDVTDQRDFIVEILMVFSDLVSKCVYPAFWCEMVMLQNSVILKSLRFLSHTIRERFLEPFENQMWNNFFHCAISFLTQSPLQLENFSASKRTRLLARYKDMRKNTAQEICTMWISLGQHKMQFVPSLVGPFLEMTLVPDTELRAMTIPLFFDMMQCEFYSPVEPGAGYTETKRLTCPSKCNFREFEQEMINKLDHLLEGGRGDGYYLEVFRAKMIDHCENHSSMREQGLRFVTTVTRLMERLLEYRAIMRDENQENKMSCTVNLLHFYSEIDCQEMYIRYLYKLCALHLAAENFIEAGFTLKLHAEQLDWSDAPLPALLRNSSHPHLDTHRAMKEALYYDIIDYFDIGHLWEAALELCKELVRQYEDHTFDYHQLSQLLKRMSQLYDKILAEIRPVPGYFRVAFYGRGFPAFLQNKVYVYRGRGYERLTDFTERIQNTFSKAELLPTLAPPGGDITDSLQQYLQINSVEPDMETSKRFSGKPLTEKILQYYRTNDVDRFVYSRPTQRGPKDPENPFASLWLERTVLRTGAKLPGILGWFLVTSSDQYDVTPLETAIETMATANRRVRELILSNRSDAELPLNPLTQLLTGIIDAAVMGGTANYQYFLAPSYLEAHPEDASLVERLQTLIAKQIPLLEAGLETHGLRAPSTLQPLQSRLEQLFDKMKADVQARFGVQECDLPHQRGPVLVRHHRRPSLAGWERQDSAASDLSAVVFTPSPQTNGSQPAFTRSLINISQSFTGGGTLKAQKSTTPSIPRSHTIFYKQSSVGSLPASPAGTPVTSRGRDRRTTVEDRERRRDTKRASVTSQASQISEASTVIELSEELRPARPLRSEAERERRLTRPSSGQYPLRSTPSTSTLSSRDSVGLTMEEEEAVPPPLPVKQSRMLSVQISTDENGISSRTPAPEELTPVATEPPPPPPKPHRPSLLPEEPPGHRPTEPSASSDC